MAESLNSFWPESKPRGKSRVETPSSEWAGSLCHGLWHTGTLCCGPRQETPEIHSTTQQEGRLAHLHNRKFSIAQKWVGAVLAKTWVVVGTRWERDGGKQRLLHHLIEAARAAEGLDVKRN